VLKFVCDCTACDWEGSTADTAEAAAVQGAEHVSEHHAAALAADAIFYLRLWSFQQVRLVAGQLPEIGAEPPAGEPGTPSHPSEGIPPGKPDRPKRER
jgi:hypothetical protein